MRMCVNPCVCVNGYHCDGLESQPVHNVVLLPLFIGLYTLRMPRTGQRLPRTFGLQLATLECIGPVSGSRYMAKLRATGAEWGLDTTLIF